MGKMNMGHEVLGGEACYSYKKYDNSNCSGEPWYEDSWTVGASIKDGCENWGSNDTSTSYYCDDGGYHQVFFYSSSNCSGSGEEYTRFYANGCVEYAGHYELNSCTMDGQCDGGGFKSME